MATDLPGILIVDDNEDNRYTLQLMLESDGHERITCAAGGNEAIALIKKEKFSLVLLDLMMPDLNGNEVLKATKSDPDQRDIPVLMISADTDADQRLAHENWQDVARDREKIASETRHLVANSRECRANSCEQDLRCRDRTGWLTMQSAANQSPQQIPC